MEDDMMDAKQLELFGDHLREKYGIPQPFADDEGDDD